MDNDLQYLMPIAGNLIRYFIIAGIAFLVFYVLFPKRFSRNKIQARLAGQKDFIREIIHSVQSSVVIGTVIAIFAFTPFRAYTQIYGTLTDFPLWWVPLSILLALAVHDTYFYWMHRAVHHPKLYKVVHLMHHKSVNPSPWAAYSFHFFEAVIEALVVPIVVCLIPMHPLALFVFGFASFIINVYGHLGFEVAPKWFRRSYLFEILNTSVHHNMHHEKFKGNYGLYFRIWDRLLGTEHPDYVSEYDRIQKRRFGTSTTSFAKKVATVGLVLFATNAFSLSAQSSIEGQWYDADDGATIAIYEENGQYFGQLISADEPGKNERLQNARAAGVKVVLLKNFEQKGEKEYCCGRIYQPKEKRLLTGTLILETPTTLKVIGQYGLLSGSRMWRKIG